MQTKQRQVQISDQLLSKAALCRLPSLGVHPILFRPLTCSSENGCLDPFWVTTPETRSHNKHGRIEHAVMGMDKD